MQCSVPHQPGTRPPILQHHNVLLVVNDLHHDLVMSVPELHGAVVAGHNVLVLLVRLAVTLKVAQQAVVLVAYAHLSGPSAE